MAECTSETCNNPTDLYLCNECVKVLADWINEAMVYLPELDAAIAKQTTISKPSEGGNGTKSGINPGINLDALQLKINLQSIDRTGEEYAHDEYAAGIAWMIEQWVKRVRIIVEGEAELPINREAIRDRLAAEVPAELKVKPLIQWLETVHDLTIKRSLIWKWAERGHITRTNTEGQATYDPSAVLIHARRHALGLVMR